MSENILEVKQMLQFTQALLANAEHALKEIEKMCECEGNSSNRHCWVMRNRAEAALKRYQTIDEMSQVARKSFKE